MWFLSRKKIKMSLYQRKLSSYKQKDCAFLRNNILS